MSNLPVQLYVCMYVCMYVHNNVYPVYKTKHIMSYLNTYLHIIHYYNYDTDL